jgi:MtN3 and saliva related transmembrane protein
MRIELLGLLSGLLTTIAFVPQVLKVWRTRSAADISLAMYLVFSLGLIGWMSYGAVLGARPIIVANGVTLVLTVSIIAMKLTFQKQ